MADAIAIAKLSMLGDIERLSALSQNISNAGTVGYKRQIPSSTSFNVPDSASLDRGFGATDQAAVSSDLSMGALQDTGRPLDVALDGEGFFVIATGAGLRYTRRGDFHLDAGGRLVTASGDPVLGTAGEIGLTSDQADISLRGDLTVDGKAAGQLQVVRFDDGEPLTYEGMGLFAAPNAVGQPLLEGVHIRQGHLEASNVRPLQDTLSMMETSRHFEMSRNALVAYDTMLDAAINTLGAL